MRKHSGIASALATAAAICLFASPSRASTVVSLVGTVNCFGIPGVTSCPDGSSFTTLGGSFSADYRDAYDLANAPFTDHWMTGSDITYVHNYNVGGATIQSATLEIETAGMADGILGPWPVFVNGHEVGMFQDPYPGQNDDVYDYLFNVNPAYLSGSSATVYLMINDPPNPNLTDGYSIDYSRLTLVTSSTATPEPNALALAGSLGTASVFALRRRLRR